MRGSFGHLCFADKGGSNPAGILAKLSVEEPRPSWSRKESM